MLLPALSKAKSKAKTIACTNNSKQIALAFTMYASDFNDFFPPLNTGNYALGISPGKDLWWFQVLDNGKYLTSSTTTNNVWRCPEVMDADISPLVTSYFHAPCEGYGPLENGLGDYFGGIIRYGLNTDKSPLGSRKVTQMRRASQIWLMGDVGVPKFSEDLAILLRPGPTILKSPLTNQVIPQVPLAAGNLRRTSSLPAGTTAGPSFQLVTGTRKTGNGPTCAPTKMMSSPSTPIDSYPA